MNTSSKMTNNTRLDSLPFARKKICAALMASLSAFTGGVQATDRLPDQNDLPENVEGISFNLSSNGRNLTVTQGVNQALIDWQELGVARNESLEFVRGMDTNGNVLQGEMVSINRILGGGATEILGRLSSEGKVFLVNQQGVIFGRNAQVNVQGLVASTLALTADPASTTYGFSGQGGPLVLNGDIQAQDLVLIGSDIEIIGGQITAPPGGRVFVLSGQSAQVQLDNGRLAATAGSPQSVRLLVTQAGLEQLQLVVQQDATGQLTALNTQSLPSGAGLQVNGAGVTVFASANGLNGQAETSVFAPDFDVAMDTALDLHAAGSSGTMNLQAANIELGTVLSPGGVSATAISGDVRQVAGNLLQAGGSSSFSGESVRLGNNSNLISGAVSATSTDPEGVIRIESLQGFGANVVGATQTNGGAVTATRTVLESESVLQVSLSQTGQTTLEGSSVQFVGPSAVEGNLSVSARHGITQTGPLNVRGHTQLTGAVIVLQNEANQFAGSVSATNVPLDPNEADQLAAELIALAESGPLSLTAIDLLRVVLPSVGTTSIQARAIEILGEVDGQAQASNVDGSLELIATDGDITQAADGGALTVTETTSLTADDVSLLNEGNQLEGLVTVEGNSDESDIAIKAESDLTVEITDSTVVGDLELQGESVTVGEAPGSAPAPAPTEPVLEVNGTLTLTAEEQVEQTTTLDVTGTSTVAGNQIELTDGNNQFTGDVTLNATGNNASVDVEAAGNLSATVNSENANTVVDLEASGTLQASVNNTGETTLTGTDVQIGQTAGASANQGSQVEGNLTIQAQGGSVTQSETLAVEGNTTVNANNTDLSLAGNQMEGQVTVNADGASSAVNVSNGEALDLVVNGTGSQPVVTAESSSNLTVTLNDAGATTLTGANVTVGQPGATGASNVEGTLTATATAPNGTVSQNHSLSVSETTTLTAATVDLDNTQNNLTGPVTVTLQDSATASSLSNAGDLSVAVASPNAGASIDVTAGGALDATVNAAGAVTLQGTSVQIGSDAPVAGSATTVGGELTIQAVGDALAGSSPVGAVTQTEALQAGAGVEINAGSVTLTDPANSVAGTLDINLAGATQTAEVLASGNLTADVSGQANTPAVSEVQLTTTQTLTAQSTGVNNLDLSATEVILGAVQVGTEDTAGSLSVAATGEVSQTGLLSVRGTSTVTGERITLGNADNLLTDLVTVTAPTVELSANSTGSAPLNLLADGSGQVTLSAGNLNFSGAANGSQTLGGLTINQTGQVTQTDSLTVLQSAAFNQSNVALNHASNDFQGAVQVNQQPGGVVSLTDANALNVGISGSGVFTAAATSVNLGGNSPSALSADSVSISADSITQTQAIRVNSLSSFLGNQITLGETGNQFDGGVEVTLTGASPNLTLASQTDLVAEVISTPEAGLNLQSAGDVTLRTDMASEITVQADNARFETLTSNTDVLDIGGQLDVRVQNEISQAQALNVAGNVLLSGQSVQLGNDLNQFASGVRLESPTGVLNARLASAEQIVVNGDGLDQLTLDAGRVRFAGGPADNTAGALAGGTRQSFEQLTVLNVRELVQDDALTVNGALLVRGTGATEPSVVQLDNDANQLFGPVRLEDLGMASVNTQASLRTSAGRVGSLQLTADEIVFADQSTEEVGTLEAQAQRISQEQSLDVQTAALSANRIELDRSDNRFEGTVSATLNGVDQTLQLGSQTDLTVEVEGSAADATLALLSEGNLTARADQFGSAVLTGEVVSLGAQNAAQTRIGQSLTVSAEESLLQSSALAGDQVQVDVNANAVILDNQNALSGNGTFTLNQPNGSVVFVNQGDFDLHVEGHRSSIDIDQTGTLGLSFSNTLNAEVRATDIRLDGGRVANRGTLSLDATNTVTQTAALDANGEVTLAGQQITLDLDGNQFAGPVILNRQGASVILRADSDLQVGSNASLAALAVSGQDVTLGSTSAPGSLTVTGDLNATATGRLSQNQGLDVTGAANFTAETIELSSAPNRFASPVLINASGQAGLSGESLVLAGGSSVGGSLALSGGSVSQTGPLSVGGGLVVNAGAVSLDDPGNSFLGGVSIGLNGSGGPLSLSTSGSLNLSLQGSATSDANIRAGGNITGQFDGVRNLSVQAGQLLNATATGFQSALFQAGQSADLTVGNGGSLSVSAGTIRLASLAGQSGAGESPLLSGNLSLLAQGLVHQAGPLSVGGSTEVSAQNISLTDSNNRFGGSVQLTGVGTDATANLNAQGDLDLNASQLSELNSNATGQVMFQGAVGSANLAAQGVRFKGPTALTNLTATAAQTIDQSGRLSVTGDSSLRAGNVLLENAANDFGGKLQITLTNSGNGSQAGVFNTQQSLGGAPTAVAKVVDQNDLDLQFDGRSAPGATLDAKSGGALNVAALGVGRGSLSAQGAISQSGSVQVQGDLTLKGSSVRLTDNSNRLGQTLGLEVSGNADLVSDSLTLRDSRVDGGLKLAALSGDLNQVGDLTVGGNAELSGRNITLNGNNDFKGLVTADVQDRSGFVSIRDLNDLNLIVRDALALNVSAGGKASLNVSDIDDLEVEAGLVHFEQGLNLGAISVESGSDVTQDEAIEANQSFRVNADGNIILQADNRVLGPVILNGLEVLFSNLEVTRLAGLVASSGVVSTERQLILQGDILLRGGRLEFVARGAGSRVPRSSMADLLPQSADVFFSREVLDPLTASTAIGFTDATIFQESGRIMSQAGSRAVFHGQGGSIVLNGSNKMDGGLQMLAGGNFGENYVSRGESGQNLISVRNEAALRIDGQGVEADLVSIQAPSLSTGPASVIRARLPYDNLVLGENRSSPALILSINGIDEFLSEPAPGSTGGAGLQSTLKPNERYRGINVNIGGAGERRLGGFVTVLPFEGAQLRPGLVVYLEGPQQQAGYRVFYDGAGDPGRIPVSYNGLIPQLPAGVTALNAIASTVEQAADQQRESVVRTENVGSRLRSGVVAEAKPGSPATSADEGLSRPELCDKASDSLQCE